MKNILIFTILLLIQIIFAQDKSVLLGAKGAYLGEIPPEGIPVVFAPGVISNDTTVEHGFPTFSPDGKAVFWQSNYRKSGEETIISCMTMRCVGNKWTAPEVSPFGDGPVFSPDGSRLYFNSKEKNGTICYIENRGEHWSKPIKLGFIKRFPELKHAYNISFTKEGTLYFLGYAKGLETLNNFAIYRSELVDGIYARPELLPASINMEGGTLNWTPFISPDESYLLFSSSRDTGEMDYGDLYISFRNADGSWNTPQNLGEKINSNRQERFPSVSPDGKYLFFTRWVARGNEDVFWVKMDFLEALKKKSFRQTD